MNNSTNTNKRVLPIISADERLAESNYIKGCILGKVGIGKTSLLWTLPAESTLFIDLEAGDLAVKDWSGDTMRPRTWQECRDLAVFLGGPRPAVRSDKPYSQAHYEAVCQKYGSREVLDKYETIFIDSITVAGRLCMQWCKAQPQALSEKTGKEDMRSVYGLHGQEMISWLSHLQHIRDKHVWFACILEERLDEFNRTFYAMQIDGSKTANELPGIVDQVITMAEVSGKDGALERKFVCHTSNPYSFPAKDRSGQLNLLEEPHLGNLMQNMLNRSKTPDRALKRDIEAYGNQCTAFVKPHAPTNDTNLNEGE